MLIKKKEIILLSLMLLVAVMAGCSGDEVLTQGDDDYQIPLEVIAGISSAQYDANFEASGGSEYYWEVDGGIAYGSFNDVTLSKPEFTATNTALQEGQVRIRVTIDQEVKPWLIVDVVDNNNETEFYEGAFHVVVPTQDNNKEGYLAAGFSGGIGLSDPKVPYAVKTEETGLTVWDTKRNELFGSMDGRFYGINDIVYPMGGDKYFLIGYRAENNSKYQAYSVKLNNKGEKEDEWSYGDPVKDVYLRDGIGIKEDSTRVNYIVAVGNSGTKSEADPYIIKINVTNNDDINDSDVETFSPQISQLNYDYYNLQSIIETINGYLVAGYVGTDSENTEGIIIELDKNFAVKNYSKYTDIKKLYKIAENGNGNFVVVGSNAYVAEVDSSLTAIQLNFNLNYTADFRDVLIDGDSYILVGQDVENNGGIAVKITNGTLDESFNVRKGSYLYSIAKATDGNYLLAGYSNNQKAYIVKINSSGDVVPRVAQ
ncbi:hypothetical protein U472_02290 [Orenia metallireducens]|uniref:PKD domain-containing protein n=1 Tax=Orenia metallireducens TaxID=1413210 RepID=A0A1C0ACE6_9FIRM|nr:hypothetical protein [Orenia metallireducens]OCL28049.1 hypothetical protein U472_02290 [Orenia metallireducens]